MNKQEKFWKGKAKEMAAKREKRRSREGQDWYDLSVRCPEFWCTRCHPHDRAVCRGHLPHYGKCMHLGQALAGSPTEWAGKMAHLQLLLHYVSKLCTPWTATVLRARSKPQVGWLDWNVWEVLRFVSSNWDKKGVAFFTGEYSMRLNSKSPNPSHWLL